jgi:hypothetical protein
MRGNRSRRDEAPGRFWSGVLLWCVMGIYMIFVAFGQVTFGR